ncbi:MAG: hypothetical protein Q7U92_18050 [Bradyrhizobium sp.]|nr:hypothetical protein [Bradyrhizobium sp.]
MNRFLKYAAVLVVLLTATEVFARGAAQSIMNSPGYQRRLQESRGHVPNQSGSIFQAPPAPIVPPPQRRHRR